MPKGVMMTEEALLANARGVAQCLGLSDADTSLVFLPLYYSYTLSQVLSTLVAGGSLVLLRNLFFPQQVFSAIAEHRVTGFGGVPTSLNILATHRAPSAVSVDSLRYILSAGGPLSPAVIDRVRTAFPGAALFNNYGCTEIGPRATAVDYASTPDRSDRWSTHSRGLGHDRAARWSTADVGESGEIVLSGPSLMKGYYRDPETTASRMSRHGFHTGDYAYADVEGYPHYQGRRDDIFKSAGEKVSAREIEDVVLAHDGVAEAAVIAMPDPVLGTVPVVYVVRRPETSCTDRELQTFCARHLSKHKIPAPCISSTSSTRPRAARFEVTG